MEQGPERVPAPDQLLGLGVLGRAPFLDEGKALLDQRLRFSSESPSIRRARIR